MFLVEIDMYQLYRVSKEIIDSESLHRCDYKQTGNLGNSLLVRDERKEQ